MNEIYVDPCIEKASTIPSSFYTSQDMYEQSKELIFAKTWQYCLTTEELQSQRQLVPFTLLPGMLDEPLLFVRDTEDELHCVSNVCTHRGNILIDAPCQAQHIKCRYHGRRFNLDGKFVHMPEFEQAKDFPSERDNLTKIPFEQFHQFIFASLAPAVPFQEVFSEINKRLFWFPFEKMRFDANRSRDYHVHAHWALYCENYLEGLHIPFVHKSLRSVIDFPNYKTEIYDYSNLQLGLANSDEHSFDLPTDSEDYGKAVAAYYYWIFPNIMLNFYPWGCSMNIVNPVNPALTKVSFLTFVLDESKLGSGAGGELDRVELEDEAIVEAVQKGVRSRFYHKGRYSPSMEQGTHHFHRLICQFMNA